LFARKQLISRSARLPSTSHGFFAVPAKISQHGELALNMSPTRESAATCTQLQPDDNACCCPLVIVSLLLLVALLLPRTARPEATESAAERQQLHTPVEDS